MRHDYIIPVVGDIWQDANGQHNLVIEAEENEEYFTTIALETGKMWPNEVLEDWNNPETCSKNDGLPFYRLLVG